ncbi:MAG TPA: hypothetical protein VMW62_00475, partial [Chloroflexota bacterium]|nr:hypothetical protein [Chloroflexota bacterium]
ARVRDLLTCRSGVYHPANHAGPQGGAEISPPRGSCRPGDPLPDPYVSDTARRNNMIVLL